MAVNTETDINLKTLQRVDPNIIEIIDNASQVAIYKYDSSLEKWEGTDVEGALFLYRRSLNPCHGFIIVNRMNTTNFVECITSDMQFQLQEPYLLYKNHCGDIIGSWFYERKDLQRISTKIQKIVLKQSAVPRRQRCASESESVGKDGGQDIMTLLSQAHKDYMSNAESQPPVNPPKADQEGLVPSPRRRFRSTGSWEESNGKTHNGLSSDWLVLPTRLSPLFSHHEIGSPVSDVDFLSPAKGHSSFKTVQHIPQLSKDTEWKKNMGSNCDTHFAAMKQSLRSNIQGNPKMMLQIHEAYISSLRSVFCKD